MPNLWVEHVKRYASENNLSYGCAMTNTECKETYKKPVVVKKVSTVPKVSKPSTVPKVSKPSTVPKITYEYMNMKEPPKDNKIKDEFNYKPIEKFVNTFKPTEKKIEPAIKKQINKDSYEKQIEMKNKQKQIEDKYYNFLGELYKNKKVVNEEDKKNIEQYREEFKTISGYNLMTFNEFKKKEKLKEPVVKPEIKQTKEPLQVLTYNNPSKYLSGYIGINNNSTTFKYSMDGEKKNKIKDDMFDIIDKKFTSSEVNKLVDALNIDTSAVFDRARNFYDDKIEAGKGVEYTDFVSLVIFPSLVKNTPKKSLTTEDKFILLLYANNIANEQFFSDAKPVNKGSVAMQFLKPKTIGAKIGFYLGKEYQQLIQDFGMS